MLEIIAGVGIAGVVGVAAHQAGDNAFEIALPYGRWRFCVGEVLPERFAVSPVEQQIALRWTECLDGYVKVEVEAVVVSGVL